MGLPKLTTCCFCFDLKTGLQIFGVLNAVLSFFMLVVCIVAASIFGTRQSVDMGDPDLQAEATGLYVITIILCLIIAAKFLADLLFIYAVTREHTGIIKAYLILWCVFFMLSNFLTFLHISDYHASAIVGHVLYQAPSVYGALLTYNFYEQINTREEL